MTAAPVPPLPTGPFPPRLTVEEFVARHSGDPMELIDGFVVELPVAGRKYRKTCVKGGALICQHVEANDLGRVMTNDSWVRTGPANVRRAGVLFYPYYCLPKGDTIPTARFLFPPELVVKVKSPTDRWMEVFARILEYLQANVRVVLLLDPETATASVYRQDEPQRILDNGDELTLPDILPGFAVPVRRLFA